MKDYKNFNNFYKYYINNICVLYINKVRVSYVFPKGDIVQQGNVKRKIEIEMKEEIEVHYIIVHLSLEISRDLITGTK